MLILVRHGESARNRAGALSGRGEVDLEDRGRAQCRAAGAELAGSDVARLITSPLRRARQTAELLDFDTEPEIDDRWIELDYGEWEGRPLSEVSKAEWKAWRGDLDFAPPGGESLRALGRRVRDACSDLVDAARERDVVVVTHVSPMKAAMGWALGVGDGVAWRSQVSTGSITRIAIRGTGPSLVSWNEVAHLSTVRD